MQFQPALSETLAVLAPITSFAQMRCRSMQPTCIIDVMSRPPAQALARLCEKSPKRLMVGGQSQELHSLGVRSQVRARNGIWGGAWYQRNAGFRTFHTGSRSSGRSHGAISY